MNAPNAHDGTPAISVTDGPTTPDRKPPESPAPSPPRPAPPAPPVSHRGPGAKIAGIVVLLILVASAVWYIRSLGTISTDDAYINGHVTFVAPRVGGQVAKVLVDDNNRVKKGDLLVQLDPEPYQTQVNIAQAAVDAAQSDAVAAQAQARALVGQARSLRYTLERAIEDVANQIALLKSKVAALQSARASLAKAQGDYERAVPLINTAGISREEFELRKETLSVAQAKVEEALQGVYQVRGGPHQVSGERYRGPDRHRGSHCPGGRTR